MRAVVQRVQSAKVTVDNEITGSIDQGLAVLVGIHPNDGLEQIRWMSDKLINLRIFEDDEGKMNLSLADIGKEMLIVSQFTLYGDCRKGRRPGYSSAAPPEVAEPLYLQLVDEIRSRNITVATGQFQAAMKVDLVNDGPVTLLLDSEKNF